MDCAATEPSDVPGTRLWRLELLAATTIGKNSTMSSRDPVSREEDPFYGDGYDRMAAGTIVAAALGALLIVGGIFWAMTEGMNASANRSPLSTTGQSGTRSLPVGR
jgi:hypothetical protein